MNDDLIDGREANQDYVNIYQTKSDEIGIEDTIGGRIGEDDGDQDEDEIRRPRQNKSVKVQM